MEETTVNVGELITTGIEAGLSAGTAVLNYIVENPYLSVFFFVSFIGLGIGIVKRFKH